MARKRKPKPVCVYCQKAEGSTRDHVFPDSWYPATTPATIQHRTVPCCPACNSRLKNAEDAVALDLLWICSPLLPEIKGVHENIFGGLNVRRGRDAEDARHRAGKVQQIRRTMEWPTPIPGAPFAYVEKNGIVRAASPARRIDGEALRTLAEKFIRGLHYIEVKAIPAEPGTRPTDLTPFLPSDLTVRASLLPNPRGRAVNPGLTFENFDPEVIAAIIKTPRITMFGPGFQYRRLWTPEGASMWLFRLWGQLDLVALAFPAALAEQVEKTARLRKP